MIKFTRGNKANEKGLYACKVDDPNNVSWAREYKDVFLYWNGQTFSDSRYSLVEQTLGKVIAYAGPLEYIHTPENAGNPPGIFNASPKIKEYMVKTTVKNLLDRLTKRFN